METFNPKNGQIYTETSSSVRSMVPSAWKRRITGRIIDPRAARHVRGASSLRDMAMRSCCWNASLFMPETLAYPGWEYAGMIYRRLKARDALSFEVWMLFQKAYPNQPELSHHFRLEKHDVVICWPSIIKSLSTLNTSVLTHFCANGLNLDLSQLILLTDIPTLAALIHINPSQRNLDPLSGSAIRDWCRAIRERKALQKLKLLYMSSIPQDGPLDSVVLDHLSSFPALALVGIERTSPRPSISHSGKHGQWQRSSPTREDKLSTTMCESQTSIAEKTRRLYRYACTVSSPQTDVDECRAPDVTTANTTSVPHPSDTGRPISLALSCYALMSARHIGATSWFIRKRYSPEEPSKRKPEGLQDDEERETKKRKIRQGKQYDVGSLLELFGPPLDDGS